MASMIDNAASDLQKIITDISDKALPKTQLKKHKSTPKQEWFNTSLINLKREVTKLAKDLGKDPDMQQN